ncbi:hypothetical protein ASZ90_015971 [hydrocarbon metagenome]|uniref:Uncharacterized protein n=1 Tax=hydrocarbon metagenome TaxID=938273 RepID=A0A0W8F0E4_9ZZZZ
MQTPREYPSGGQAFRVPGFLKVFQMMTLSCIPAQFRESRKKDMRVFLG